MVPKREILDEMPIDDGSSSPSSLPPTIVDTSLFSTNIHSLHRTPSSFGSTAMTNNDSSSNSMQISPFPGSNSAENKRRRVTRACDNCRQKKVKCDGKQPCIHCTVYSYKCTYDQPNIRNKKNSGIPIPSQPSATVLAAAAAAAAASHSHINDEGFPNNNLVVSQNILNILLPKLKLNIFDQNFNFDLEKFQKAYQFIESKNSNINLNELSELYLEPNSIPSPIASSSNNNRHDRQSSVSSNDDGSIGKEIKLYLPSKDIALQLIYITWNKACVLFRFYHRPSLLEEVDLLYSLDPYNYGDRQQKFLPFLYSILACGSLFSKTNDSSPNHNESLEDEGFKYFLEARKLIDISNVGDINSIQTIVMMIMYLQCSARLSTCYSYIGIALRSALKEGLHRNLSIFQNSRRKLDPIEIDTRKRLFYTIYKMDIYINSLLGLPRSLNEDEFDQELPEELDDENITRKDYLYDKQEGRVSSSACANQHTKLMLILSHIVKKLYPIKVKLPTNSAPLTPDSIHTKVTELEFELKNWLDNLPPELKPTDPNDFNLNNNIPEKFLLANYYLHLAFLNCQIMLYRPFIHFISDGGRPNSNTQSTDPRSLIRGRNCIKVARLVVKLADKMIAKNLLVGTYWFSMYTIFFSIACLIYYYHFANYNNNNNNSNSQTFSSGANYAGVLFDDDLNIDMIKKDIEVGRKLLDHLKTSSNASSRIYNILNTLFEQLNRRTATTSRFRSTRLNQQSIPSTISGVSGVEATFNNFDKMNNFENNDANGAKEGDQGYNAYAQQKTGSDKRDSLGQLFTDTTLATFQASSVVNNSDKNESDNAKLIKDPMKSVVKTETPEQAAELLGHTSSESQSLPVIGEPNQNENIDTQRQDEFGNNYMPGPFDKLDAQIFGRILPPYMLEKNASRTTSITGIPTGLTPVSDGSNPASVRAQFTPNHPQQPQPQPQPIPNLGDPTAQLSHLNLDSFDFSSLGDPNNLDFLDPYSSVYSDFKN